MKNDSFQIENINAIDAFLQQSMIVIADHSGTRPGNDEVTLTIPDVSKYGSDLILDDRLILHFDKTQARRLGWLLIKLAGRLKLADERTIEDFTGLHLLPPELENVWRK